MTSDSAQKLLNTMISQIKKRPLLPLTPEEKAIYLEGRYDAVEHLSNIRDSIIKNSEQLGSLGINSIK